MTAPTPEAIEAAAEALCLDANYTFPAEATHEATVALSAAYPLMVAQAKAEAWDEGAVTAWERSTPTVNGTHYNWRHAGLPRNPYRAEPTNSKESQ